ncbi:zinc finger protein [Holotrichia oblita]|uniref:Zinc finger protein n=1 Tax=Holotrichia oblita TaxID=644536 RepID=A0ACB9SUA6_HOLOL|nr:zinc finger protein [Holotrichia oblita]
MCDTSIKMFGPLTFQETLLENEELNVETPCLLCDDKFNLNLCFTVFLKHCFEVHNLVIEDVQHIHNLHEYIIHWKEKFKHTAMERIIPSLKVDSSDDKYYFISPLIKEDEELRHRLKLEITLKRQEYERTDESYENICLFCRLQLKGTRANYLNHLSVKHNLQLGNPQNLVYIDELIEKIEEKLNNLQCIYCEKIFPERGILKEHMRKKMHKTINPHNRDYDKYYIVNYLEPNKTWDILEKEDDHLPMERGVNSDEEYSDWNEVEHQIICLFCKYKHPSIENIYLHLNDEHKFNFKEESADLDFYQCVKLVNYIRRQIYNLRCICCDTLYSDCDELQKHMIMEGHNKIPDVNIFNQPEYYFPTYENDAFLFFLEDREN